MEETDVMEMSCAVARGKDINTATWIQKWVKMPVGRWNL
jgi:hypothetical protein